jgi:glutathione S-transferase
MLKVWGRKNSINVQKVLWCCDELNLDYERIDAGGEFGLNREPEYLAMNPNGLIPTISDDGFVLWESNAIVRYLASRHGAGTLYPEDLQHRADADRWMDWHITEVYRHLGPVFLGLVRTPPGERDEATIEAARQQAAEAWKILDDRLSGRAYVTGSSFTMADIPLGAAVYRWYELDIERPETPNLEAWYGRLRERPAYRERVMLPLT